MEIVITSARAGMVNDLVHCASWGKKKPKTNASGNIKFRWLKNFIILISLFFNDFNENRPLEKEIIEYIGKGLKKTTFLYIIAQKYFKI